MKEIAKTLLRMLLGDYSAYYIYSASAEEASVPEAIGTTAFRMRPIDESVIASCAELLIRKQVSYAGAGSRAYACFDGDRIVSVCFYWFGDRYLKRNFWPLADREA
jgi:hypothetical protein